MTMQPDGEMLLPSGRQLGATILQLLPATPWEGPPWMPRGMAKQLFPSGFMQPAALPVPVQAAAIPPAAPPAVIPRPAAVVPAAANQVIPQVIPRPAAPAPEPDVPHDRSFDPLTATARSERIPLRESRGM